MSMLTKPAFGPKAALTYVTVGALIVVWTVVYYFVYGRSRMQDADDNAIWFWVAGFFLSGLVLIVIGLALGRLGRAAREAELPPEEAAGDEARIKANAAMNPNPMIAGQVAGTVPPGVASPVVMPTHPGAAPQPQSPRPPTGYAQPSI
jgi:hypothetical protein